MYETFASNLEKANNEEANLQKSFEDVIAEKTKQNKLYSETATTKAAEKAEKSQMLSESEEKLQSTQEQMKEDEEFFATATTGCHAKAQDWDERKRLRVEELDGINKALDILTSDEAKAQFDSVINTRPVDTFNSSGVDVDLIQDFDFIQTKQTGAPRERAYKLLTKVVG